MKKKKTVAALPVWGALAGLLIIGGAELAIFLVSGCAPLLALSLVHFLSGGVNLLLLLPLGKQRSLKAIPQPKEGRKPKLFKCLPVWLGNGLRKIANFWNKHWSALVALLLAAALFVSNYFFWPNVRADNDGTLAYWMPVVLAAAFVISVALEKICGHVAEKKGVSARFGAVARNMKDSLLLGRIGQALTAAAMLLKLIGLYDAHLILQIALLALFLYETVLLVLSIAIRLIRKELATAPELPLSFRAMGKAGVLTYLEENTGITMRSLWSIRLIRRLLPGVVTFVVLLVWLFSGVIQIEAHQEGALYRLGKLRPETLKPGLHMVLPWPFDKVEVHDTQSLRKVVVGYIPNGKTDNTWTENHGTEEYRLLLGGGNEMVSINLQVEYRIEDLNRYLSSSASAESLLLAEAYEIVTARTIATDIDALLSADRTAFSQTFQQELEEHIGHYDLGIQVTNVVLESIHPPVEVARTYQDVISAGIRAEQLILTAQREAVLETASAKQQAYAEISIATTTMHQEIAAAKGEVAEFMAAVEAYQGQPAAYTYYKYMNALTDAYTRGVLLLLGEDVDEGALVIGDLTRPEELDPYYIEPEVEEEYWEE